MKFLLTMAFIAFSTLTVSAQAEVKLGQSTDKQTWFTVRDFIQPIVNQRYMTAMYTTPRAKGTHVVIFVEVDCSDNTIRLHGMDSYRNMRKINSIEEVTQWANPKGIAVKLYQFVCGMEATGQIS